MREISNKEAILVLITSTAIILLLVIIVIVALLFQLKRKHRHQKQLADMQGQYERTLLQTELKIQEETFKVISQNLHDNIGSNISTAMLLLYKDNRVDPQEEEANKNEAILMLDKVVDDLKNIARSLNPDYLNEIGLSEAIRQRIQQLEKTKKYQIDYFLNDPPQRLDSKKQVILYYIFQEVINNINTHAKANRISINLHYEKDQLQLRIQDNGKGINYIRSAEEQNGAGWGLMNMKHHAGMIGARLTIESDKEKGTGINMFVPNPYN